MERERWMAMATLVGLICDVYLVTVSADVGTATSYDPPYLPTKCPGYTEDQLPENGLFVAAGSGMWDNGAACGRKYQLRCLSGLRRPCKDGSIVVEVSIPEAVVEGSRPDKNKAPGAEEAFKEVSMAFHCLSDAESWERYDLCGSEESALLAKASSRPGFDDDDDDDDDLACHHLATGKLRAIFKPCVHAFSFASLRAQSGVTPNGVSDFVKSEKYEEEYPFERQ
ncbi:hypothetical protein OPV22_023923 [Ensete ventricosum]|uniref:Expansin-like EG45 domain-containing protein n=1 Tax=Ensete ventricosum TaxID=4639 RepID=A0AAV8PFR9_ENSVE|nr:hypothetical protein OPV22_023923 [Ensete ventricosum]